MSTVYLMNYDVSDADIVVRVMLTRHIKMDCECNCDVCTKRI